MRFVFLLLGLLCASLAWADAVPPSPSDCPSGTIGGSDHYGPHCRPAVCKADAECSNGQACVASSMCVKRVTYGSPRGDTYRVEAVGACGRDGGCPEGSSCEAAKYCGVPSRRPPPANVDEPGAGCGVAAARGSPFSLLALLLFALNLRGRRARRE